MFAGEAPALHRIHTLNILGFQPLVAGDHLKRDFVTFVEGFESRADNGRVMDENVLPGTLGDEPKPFFVIKPLNFAASHIIKTPEFEVTLEKKKRHD
jgi:hypothetical protein